MYLREVEELLKSSAPKTKTPTYFEPESYMGTGFFILGLPVPQQRNIFKKGYSFSKEPLMVQLKIWDKIWEETKMFEALTQAAFFPEKHWKKLGSVQTFKTLKSWIKKVDNWGHSDLFSSIIAKILVTDEQMVFNQLIKWNASKNPWERRQSIVPLAMYHRRNKHIPFKQVISLVENLIHDDHYYVQKGVGWSLREIGTQYPEETWKFMNKYVRDISAIAFTASVEKLSTHQKEKLKQLRKKK
jgi:3-methyladenine DNA glycosylase AlkD